MIAYDRLSTIIPPDMALANKALQVAMQQISGVSNMNLPTLANTVSSMQTTKDLPLLSQQNQPINGDTRAYYLNVLGAYGTGVCNTILTVDMLGTAIGHVNNEALANAVAQLKTMNTTYLQACYQTILNLINGVYTSQIPNPAYPPTPPEFLYQIDIPGGSPGAGSYGPYLTPSAGYNDVTLNVLIPATQSTITGLASTYPKQVAQLNVDFNAICQQMGNEQDLQVRSGLNFADFFANLQANSSSATMSFIFALPGYGLDVIQGGAAQFIEGIADYNPITGTITVGSTTVTNIPSFLGVTTANAISGTGIASNAVVGSFNTGAKTLTMSIPATATIPNTAMVVGNIGGQAILAVMRQSVNQQAINNAGVLTNSNVPLAYPTQPPLANLIPATYTTAEATALLKNK